ncbi:uncharacterized protein N0V89_005972 [Didymosphaeria variabile]|uniref:Uncharacterized protein n=1 Tax=Didymosphaeria variabile TaxID=1932322 RepID=A0A9W8XN73_9PLEO|nr:uncharacterized protein N0V89_005972 [Didymosphaeria variabile]KAJ4354238.1 hypothetical protein N0V89_005972 [Didymosphaeria variabile]
MTRATTMADNLLYLFINHIPDLYQSSHDVLDSFYEARASMSTAGVTVPDLEAKAMELQSLVNCLEVKGNQVEALLRQVDLDTVGKLLSSLSMYQDLTEAQARGMVLEYCQDVRLKFYWCRPQALEVKKTMIAGTLSQVKRARIDIF